MSSKNRTQVPNPDRRRFMTTVGAAACALALAGIVPEESQAAELPKVSETESLAVTMAYKADATKVDPKKSPTYKAGQTCLNCKLYQGKAGDFGPCTLFAGKAVAAKGWCVAYAKK
ncbi:MAG TPA: high-potential iron-sulfur protein [Steroidobacteraceae bacterium]|nr:high-potential iron-sulfur protein [Steroidobacteraceae bacterium]